MTKINITYVVKDNAMCSTINDMDTDVASYVAADMPDDVALFYSTWALAHLLFVIGSMNFGTGPLPCQ